MNQEQVKKLNQLFNQFAQETQASSFAVENLLNKTIQVINSDNPSNKLKEKQND